MCFARNAELITKHYKIKTSPLFNKQFSKLDLSVRKLIAKYIKNNLDGCDNPRAKGRALSGNKKGIWRYRIGDYRLLCEINDDEILILILNIGHRKEVYK